MKVWSSWWQRLKCKHGYHHYCIKSDIRCILCRNICSKKCVTKKCSNLYCIYCGHQFEDDRYKLFK